MLEFKIEKYQKRYPTYSYSSGGWSAYPKDIKNQDELDEYLQLIQPPVGGVFVLGSTHAGGAVRDYQYNLLIQVCKSYKDLEFDFRNKAKPFRFLQLLMNPKSPWVRWDSLTEYTILTGKSLEDFLKDHDDIVQNHCKNWGITTKDSSNP